MPPLIDQSVLGGFGPTAEITPSTGVELILSTLHVAEPLGSKRFATHDAWRDAQKAVGAQTLGRFVRLGPLPMINLVGLAFDAATPPSASQLVRSLESADPTEVVLTAVGAYRRTTRRVTDADTIRSAVAGDRGARVRLFATSFPDAPDWQKSLRYLLRAPADEVGNQVVSAIRRWHETVFAPREAAVNAAQVASRDSLMALRRSWTAEALLAHVLPGVDYVPPPAVVEVLFVPDVVVRPALVFLDHRALSIATYPAGETGGPSAEPPDALVQLGKALGDEIRLRALRALASGPMTMGDLATELKIPRSTLSYHVGLLRSSGLVSMGIDDGRWGRLRLRADGFEQAAHLFRRYVGLEHNSNPENGEPARTKPRRRRPQGSAPGAC